MSRRLVIKGALFEYADKAPYVSSGRSIAGALEVDAAGTKIKCHECGRYFRHVAYHAKKHGITSSEYRRRHGLNRWTKLCTPRLGFERSKRIIKRPERERCIAILAEASAAGKTRVKRGRLEELRNVRTRCYAQVIEKIKNIAVDLNRTPTSTDLRGGGIDPQTARRILKVGTLDQAMELCGLAPNNYTGGKYSRQILVELLRDAYASLCRPLRAKDCAAPLLPSVPVFQYHFGTWNNALREAGLSVFAESPTAVRSQ